MQIAAATIADFFGGDVAAFQQEEGGLFDGIRLVLDQQFARLTPLEREILVWLAIERQTVTPTYDFSGLQIRQAHLRNASAAGLRLTDAHLRDATFSDDFTSVQTLAFDPADELLAAGAHDGRLAGDG